MFCCFLSVDHWNIDRATGILLEPTTKQLQERIASSIQQLQNENNHVFHNPNVTFYMKMKRLLFLFQANLLQLHVTKSEETYVDILMNKYDRDHVHARPISSIFKILFGLIWLVAVILMIFYILYFGSDIDESTTNYHTSLQKAWLYSVFCYLSFDILLVESVRVVVSDVCIPLMIMSSCVDMKKRLLDVVIQQQHQQHGNLSHTDLMSLVVAAPSNVSPTRSKTGFNLAKYIFSSYQLATQQLQNPGAQMSNEELETGEQRPSDRIIQIILLFQTSLPMLQFTSRKAVEDHKKTGSNCVVAMWNGIVRFFTKLPIGLQDLILTIVTVLVMGYTVFYHIQIYQSKAAFIATPIILIVDFVVVLFVIAYYRQPVLNNDLLTDHKMPSSSGLAKDIAQDIEASSNKAPEPKHQTIAVSQPNEQQL